ncbi:MAG: alpha/beta fold hydrolase [Rhodocyclaceae bacterium]
MLARRLRFLLAGELSVWVVASLAAGASSAAAAALAFAAPAAVRAAFILLTFWWSFLRRSPRAPQARIGPGATLRMIAGETAAFLALYLVLQPFERALMGADRLARCPARRPPVVAVHGYLCNRGSWWWLRRRLERAGFCVASLNLEPPFGSIDEDVEQLHRRIEQVCAESGAAQVAILGHSMGGLVARGYLARHGGARVACVITLGSPHHGSELAAAGLGRNAAQMHPGSAWLAATDALPLPRGIAVSAIYSAHDNFVVPQAAQRLDGAENITLSGLGHLQLLFSGEVAARVIERLLR